MKYESVRGMRDILPGEIGYWKQVEEKVREVATCFCYREIRLPLIEHTELFSRGIGEETDIVNKEMYTFLDKKNRSLTLRPEATASVVRAYLEHGLHVTEPFQKLFYIGPMFRYEKPQKGRSRQFHQYGVEAIGSLDPALDADVISFAWTLMDMLGLSGLSLRLNSIGCAEDRQRYKKALSGYFATHIDEMCTDCQRRYDSNPLRILDCKNGHCQPHIQQAPASIDYLCADCDRHFAEVQGCLDKLGLNYGIDARLIRGLDYYTRTVFELISKDLGAQDALLGGGRYDGLVQLLGGPDTPGVGFAGGMERLILVLQKKNSSFGREKRLDLFLAALGEEGRLLALTLAQSLRSQGISVDLDYRGRSLRKQLGHADQIEARYLIVLGEDELSSKQGRIKNMDKREEYEISLTADAIAHIVQGSKHGD